MCYLEIMLHWAMPPQRPALPPDPVYALVLLPISVPGGALNLSAGTHL